MENPSFIKVNSPKHVCLRGYHRVFLIKTHWSFSKYNDLLHSLNVYKIPGKEHQVVELFSKYLENVPLKLRNYKKLKRTKFVWFTNFSSLSPQEILMATVE